VGWARVPFVRGGIEAARLATEGGLLTTTRRDHERGCPEHDDGDGHEQDLSSIHAHISCDGASVLHPVGTINDRT
jgi:hypothetical protein